MRRRRQRAPALCDAATTAKRVFPTPPGPTSVTNRFDERACVSSSSSAARPMKVVQVAGRPTTCGVSVDSRSEARVGQTGGAPALDASSRRSAAPSLRSKDDTWLSTVRTEICSFWAICALVRCSPRALSTSASRTEIVVESTVTTMSIVPRFAGDLYRVRGESVVSSVANPWPPRMFLSAPRHTLSFVPDRDGRIRDEPQLRPGAGEATAGGL